MQQSHWQSGYYRGGEACERGYATKWESGQTVEEVLNVAKALELLGGLDKCGRVTGIYTG